MTKEQTSHTLLVTIHEHVVCHTGYAGEMYQTIRKKGAWIACSEAVRTGTDKCDLTGCSPGAPSSECYLMWQQSHGIGGVFVGMLC